MNVLGIDPGFASMGWAIISFGDDGTLLVSPVVDRETLASLGVPSDGMNVADFTTAQKHFLAYHRRELFLKATRGS